jgi:hypothetical protein
MRNNSSGLITFETSRVAKSYTFSDASDPEGLVVLERSDVEDGPILEEVFVYGRIRWIHHLS